MGSLRRFLHEMVGHDVYTSHYYNKGRLSRVAFCTSCGKNLGKERLR